MTASTVQFGTFRLDAADRSLWSDGKPVKLSARYLDVLILLVEADGALVGKNRFMDEVWRGVPVTDEALTQAVKSLRKALGDSAQAPRYIETVPKYGYRFVARVEPVAERSEGGGQGGRDEVRGRAHVTPVSFLRIGSAGAGGAMLAGICVGLLYGLLLVTRSGPSSNGALSLILVSVLVATISSGTAGLGIAAGIAGSSTIRLRGWPSPILGGALGGLMFGAVANLVGKDAFRLLLGKEVGDFAGGLEGLVMGSVVGASILLARKPVAAGLAIAVCLGALGGVLVALLDGRMMAGSLQEFVRSFPDSHFRFDALGDDATAKGFGPVGRLMTSAFEGALFTVGMSWAILLEKRWPSTDGRQ